MKPQTSASNSYPARSTAATNSGALVPKARARTNTIAKVGAFVARSSWLMYVVYISQRAARASCESLWDIFGLDVKQRRLA